MAAHLGSFVTAWFALGLIAPLVVLLVKGGQLAVRAPARRRIAELPDQRAGLRGSALLMFVLIGFVLLPLYGIFYLSASCWRRSGLQR